MKTMVKNFSYRGQHYSIVFDGKFYMTVNHKFIGEDGKLVKELRYNDGLHTSNSIEECIELTKNDLDIQHFESQGMSKAEAFSKVMNVPIEIAKMIYEVA